MMKKRATIDDLAAMVKKGFDEVYKNMDSGFSIVNEKLDGVENRLGSVENRLGSVENRLGSVENRLDKVESSLVNIKGDTSYLKNRVIEVGMWMSKHEDEHDEIKLRFKKLEKVKT